MAARSKTFSICALQNRTGSTSYHVLGTVRPKERQRKQHFACLEDAVAAQTAWDAERMGVRAALRPKITRVNVQQLAQAEAAVQVLEGSGLSLIDAVKHAFPAPPPTTTQKKLTDALSEFLAERNPFVGPCQYENLRLADEQFQKFVGDSTLLSDLTTQNVCDSALALDRR